MSCANEYCYLYAIGFFHTINDTMGLKDYFEGSQKCHWGSSLYVKRAYCKDYCSSDTKSEKKQRFKLKDSLSGR